MARACGKMRPGLVVKGLDSIQEGSPPGFLSRGVTRPGL